MTTKDKEFMLGFPQFCSTVCCYGDGGCTCAAQITPVLMRSKVFQVIHIERCSIAKAICIFFRLLGNAANACRYLRGTCHPRQVQQKHLCRAACVGSCMWNICMIGTPPPSPPRLANQIGGRCLQNIQQIKVLTNRRAGPASPMKAA